MADHRITTPFGATSRAADVIQGVDLTGRRAIVTGGASGIGFETARSLASAGAEVTLAVRDLEAGRRAAADIGDAIGRAAVRVAPLDLADRASIATFVVGWNGPLHILVDNAGIMASPELRTPEGGNCSSPPTISGTSHSPSGCTMRSLRRPGRVSSW
jgi:NAD(P)-dependent dehydrogenase (short-subunit alcohol dehydrogenase family)